MIHNCLVFKRLIDREELQPLVLRGTVPICMSQYERLFSTTRIPGVDVDELCHYSTSESKMSMNDLEPRGLPERGKLMLHGDGRSIWFDKSLSVQVFKDATAGMNCEHSMADAPAMAHMWEYIITRE
ncbi:hypothetical protein V5799_021073 [Amblyomma americanum]|uniref:Choline/carnitine acyltransferase domain-containing protein n=1 Tax=Amblyomma americanum TaxID=6943 RepID=A0AAQ4FPL6_AMBAM